METITPQIFPKSGVLPSKGYTYPLVGTECFFAQSHISRLMHVKSTLSLLRFLAMPRQRTFRKPNLFLRQWNGCSTLQRIEDFRCSIILSQSYAFSEILGRLFGRRTIRYSTVDKCLSFVTIQNNKKIVYLHKRNFEISNSRHADERNTNWSYAMLSRDTKNAS